jgi:beta-carotene/zeaxanthin 4-ketolase
MVLSINHQGNATDQQKNKIAGMAIASLVIMLWITSLISLLTLDIQNTSPIWSIAAFLLRIFLSTGLFITAHDAMHGSVFPNHLKLNHGVGTIALFLYGLLPYKEMLRKHHLHHRFPTGDRDPDFHENQNFGVWYFHFMKGYWSWSGFFAMLAIGLFLHGVLHVAFANLLLFWLLPLAFSSLQLFYFGTFLPHRRSEEGYEAPYYSRTHSLPSILSFLTCYHFGYHYEHHQYPQVPWWQLPRVHQQSDHHS